jgi:hypothetical protein
LIIGVNFNNILQANFLFGFIIFFGKRILAH